jgi:PIN domain nuclease of toxin-antitoxin system
LRALRDIHAFLWGDLDDPHIAALPPIHDDPFDRLLVAQAQLEGLPIITADPAIGRYDVDVIW